MAFWIVFPYITLFRRKFLSQYKHEFVADLYKAGVFIHEKSGNSIAPADAKSEADGFVEATENISHHIQFLFFLNFTSPA